MNLGLLCIPFFIMVAINQLYSPKPKNIDNTKFGIKTQNTGKYIKNKCTWACHNNTLYCKQNHVKLTHKYLGYTDPFYFGAIKTLKAGGNYQMANIILLVLLMPFSIWFFITRALKMNNKINYLKKQSTPWK